MNNYKLVKRYRILDRDSVVEVGIQDSNTALNHILYKVTKIANDCISCGSLRKDQKEEAIRNRLKVWTIEEYYIVSLDEE